MISREHRIAGSQIRIHRHSFVDTEHIGSFVAKRHHGIHFRCAARRDVASQERDDAQHERNDHQLLLFVAADRFTRSA